MNRLLLPLAALCLALPAAAQDLAQDPAHGAVPPALNLDQRLLLRCSATFALVAFRQEAGVDWALALPPMGERGREFFVRASALVMDETGIGPDALDRLLSAEAESIVAANQIEPMMPLCMGLLEQAGL
jgi:hypothetical protein